MSKEVAVISGKMRQQFDEAAKKKIVADSLTSNLSLNQYAKKVGVSPATLCQWRKASRAQDVRVESMGQSNQSYEDLIKENHLLKTENLRLKAFLGHKLFEIEAPRFV